ncbi:MAG: hypothetical protein CVT70_16190 [Alphaproteobacteria bacterium HGW-Alphaproteobacteria-1]|jgi:hypothetical protein|nr:MAG: hypothetical protein CVT70_16190 [Alphaproteobacteria bacterium HGW-Alphaproteobacteria-1]
MKVWKAKAFARWARKEGLDDDDLLQAADEIASGLFEGNLGGDIVKKRVARAGGGKRGGFRTIVAYRSASSSRLFFLHGFAKNAKADVTPKEKAALQTNAGVLLGLSGQQLKQLEIQGDLIAVRRIK